MRERGQPEPLDKHRFLVQSKPVTIEEYNDIVAKNDTGGRADE